jgi:hypothetical protein
MLALCETRIRFPRLLVHLAGGGLLSGIEGKESFGGCSSRVGILAWIFTHGISLMSACERGRGFSQGFTCNFPFIERLLFTLYKGREAELTFAKTITHPIHFFNVS